MEPPEPICRDTSENAVAGDTAAAVWKERLTGFCAVALLSLGVLLVYCPPDLLSGDRTLVGGDYFDLHHRRIQFAQEALFGPRSHLPAWYPRELLGTPFWSNVQSFPFIPTRLILLPIDRFIALPVGVIIGALLAAWFTYFYCRSVHLGRVGAVAAGWTFACAGYYASRVMVGHLPLLEAYPALPLLLWLVERSLQAEEDRRYGLKLLVLALATGCIVMAGHPQLSIYSLEAAVLYILYRGRSRKGLKAAAAMGLGMGAASFVMWPMVQLIGRSTRVLALAVPDNNIYFPAWRLGTFLFPWKDGWPSPVDRGQPMHVFTGPPPGYDNAYFWDTVCYVGWMPLIALGFLSARAIWRRKAPSSPWPFFIALGSLALLLALPMMQHLLSRIPGTILRSPSRQLYLTTFCLALALAVAVDVLIRSQLLGRRGWAWGLVGLALAIHFVDLRQHDKYFIYPVRIDHKSQQSLEALQAVVGDGRVAFDVRDQSLANRQIDDVGFFDSIMLARPYRAMMDMAAAPPGLNTQWLDGAELNARTLAYAGVKRVITKRPRPDLNLLSSSDGVHTYAVPNPAPRAAFIPLSHARYLDEQEIHRRLRDQQIDLQSDILLSVEAGRNQLPAASLPATNASGLDASVLYSRPSSDEIIVKTSSNQPGYVRILESWDPGWRASIDGRPVPILAAEDFVMAVRVEAGEHQVSLSYHTPGAPTGAAMSLTSLCLLLGLVAWNCRTPKATRVFP